MARPGRTRTKGLTLVELMITIAVVVVLLAIVGPSFKRMIELQRLRSINAQLVTDMQLARTEAAARGTFVRVTFRSNASTSCYSIYTFKNAAVQCNCLSTPACANPALTEVRTARVPADSAVTVKPCSTFPTCMSADDFSFDPITGGIYVIAEDLPPSPASPFSADTKIDAERTLRTVVGSSGRPTVCRPSGSTVEGVAAC